MINISIEENGYNYDGSTHITSNNISDYDFHNLTVFRTLTINEREFELEYQTGIYYHHNDYSLPSNKLGMYQCDDFIYRIIDFYESDINQDAVDDLKDDFDCNFIETPADLLAICNFLNEEKIYTDDYEFEIYFNDI